jgi:uncharacterized RDD family membrane protein YckC
MSVHYETPENVQLEYTPAGLGTRFIAWFIDNIIVFVITIVVFILLVVFASATSGVTEQAARWIRGAVDDPDDPQKVGLIFMAIGLLILNLGSMMYFTLCEWFMGGQTFGKRSCHIRVVKAEGFALDLMSVVVRNVFRVADHIPALWIVPVLSARSQRFGDMAAGTIVVSDEPNELSPVRAELSTQTALEAQFPFNVAKLDQLRPSDFSAIEQLLGRWDRLQSAQRDTLAESMIDSLCSRMDYPEPPMEARQRFLEDLLAAHYRREDRRLR